MLPNLDVPVICISTKIVHCNELTTKFYTAMNSIRVLHAVDAIYHVLNRFVVRRDFFLLKQEGFLIHSQVFNIFISFYVEFIKLKLLFYIKVFHKDFTQKKSAIFLDITLWNDVFVFKFYLFIGPGPDPDQLNEIDVLEEDQDLDQRADLETG